MSSRGRKNRNNDWRRWTSCTRRKRPNIRKRKKEFIEHNRPRNINFARDVIKTWIAFML